MWGQLLADPEVKVIAAKELAPWVREEDVALAERLLPPASFRRFFGGEWVEASGSFISIEEWDRCRQELPPLDATTPVVLGLDIGIHDDHSGVVAVSRLRAAGSDGRERTSFEVVNTPFFTLLVPRADDDGPAVAIRACRLWRPPPGGSVDLQEVFEWLVDFCGHHQVIQITCDPHQGEYLMQRLRERGVWVHSFEQQDRRLRADSLLLTLIRGRRLAHDGNEDLREHIQNCAVKLSAEEERGVRIIKAAPPRKVDLAVAASMAVHQCLKLLL